VLSMVGRPIDALFPERAAVTAAAPVLQVQGLSEPGVLRDICLDVGAGEIVGIAGLMGSGRSELARTIFGLDGHASGSIRMKATQLRALDVAARLRAGMALVTEDRRHEGLMLDASVADNMALAALPRFARGGRVRDGAIHQAMQALGTRLNLKSGPIDTTAIRTLSGGNQQKVVLARWLMREPSLFILDEPTRGVDIGAKQEIYRLLAELSAQGMAILIISSELEELLGLCDRIHVMRRGALAPAFARAQFDRAAILSAAFGHDLEQRGVG
jgi:ribose transport system ATP-binding protein